MNKRTERMINKIYDEIFKKIFNRKRITQASKGQSQNVVSAILQLQNSEQYNKFAEKFAKKLASAGLSNQRGLWKKYYQAAKARHYIALPDTYSRYELQLLEQAVKHNFKMIKSIPQHIMKVYEQEDVQTVISQIAQGKAGRKTFETQLKNHGAKNAKLIARTESAKLQTTIDEYRSTSLGSVCYEWRSSKDKRTRQSHRKMNGVIVFWRPDNQKPLLDKMRGNAGEFPNCRCTPLPILDENDITESKYKVYDYRTDTIINISAKELIKDIQKGGL